jgi:hypothetical protein
MESTPQPHRAQHEVCAALSRPDALVLTVAASGDIGAVFDMVNTAYKVEDGDSGVAFKKTDRFLSHDEGDAFNPLGAFKSQPPSRMTPLAAVQPSIAEGRVFLAAAAESPRVILGCIIWDTSATHDGNQTIYFGPLAVAPEAQGKGVGSFLVSAVECLAAALRDTSAPSLTSVR